MNIQLGELQAQDVMSKQVICIDACESIATAIRMMETHRVSALPVVDENQVVVGTVSAYDLIELTREIQADLSELSYVDSATRQWLVNQLAKQGNDVQVQEIMTQPVKTISPSTNLVIAAREMLKWQVHRLPIVDSNGRPVGILSTSDFVRAFAKHASLLAG